MKALFDKIKVKRENVFAKAENCILELWEDIEQYDLVIDGNRGPLTEIKHILNLVENKNLWGSYYSVDELMPARRSRLICMCQITKKLTAPGVLSSLAFDVFMMLVEVQKPSDSGGSLFAKPPNVILATTDLAVHVAHFSQRTQISLADGRDWLAQFYNLMVASFLPQNISFDRDLHITASIEKWHIMILFQDVQRVVTAARERNPERFSLTLQTLIKNIVTVPEDEDKDK